MQDLDQLKNGDVRTEISAGLVRLLNEYYGVGPSQAKTYYVDEFVACVIRGGFTRVKQTPRASGSEARRASTFPVRTPGAEVHSRTVDHHEP